MNLEDERIIGIVGGMGPQAGLALFDNILCHTNATTDQQHLSVILMSFPKYIVDRTLFLEGTSGTNPAFNIVKIIQELEKVGARVIGIPCNTSHSPEIYDVILKELDKINSKVKLVNMPFETCKFINDNYPQARRIGLMATNGTFKSRIYENLLKIWGYDVIIPDYKFQNDVIHKMIYDSDFGIKSNPKSVSKDVSLLLDKALCFFKERRSDAVILGCTELSLIPVNRSVNDILIVDSTEILAKALIREVTSK